MVKQFMKYERRSDTLQLVKEMKVWRNGQYEDLSDQELSSTGKLLSHLNVAARVVSTKRKIKLTK